MSVEFAVLGIALVCALICARWSMELGDSQLVQLLWGLAGFFCGPLVLLLLYIHLLRAQPDGGKRWFTSTPPRS
jgi:phage shock protein PspC (stress-responsive transcriptional regulator)